MRGFVVSIDFEKSFILKERLILLVKKFEFSARAENLTKNLANPSK